MDHAHRDIGLFLRKALEVGLRADDREGPFVDRVAVVDIVVVPSCSRLVRRLPRARKPNSFEWLAPSFLPRRRSAGPARRRLPSRALRRRLWQGERLIPRRAIHDKPGADFARRPKRGRPRRDGRSPWRSRTHAGAPSRRASRCIRWRFRRRAVAPGYGRTRIPARRGRPRSPAWDRRARSTKPSVSASFASASACARVPQIATSVRFGAGRMSSTPRSSRRFGKCFQQSGVGMAEGQGDAESSDCRPRSTIPIE